MRGLAAGITAAAVTVAAAATLAVPALARPDVADRAKPVRVTVRMDEFSFRLSRRVVPRGRTIVFTVINRGGIPHDFAFVRGVRKKTRLLAPGRRAVLRVVFKKRGLYQYICTVPRHAQNGMAGTLRVR